MNQEASLWIQSGFAVVSSNLRNLSDDFRPYPMRQDILPNV